MLTGFTINKSIDINSDPAGVWNVLVNPEMIRQYFAGAETITDWQPGSEIIFIHHYNGEEFRNKGVIIDYKVNQLLSYTYWTAFSRTLDSPENYTTLTYHIGVSNGTTILSLTQSNMQNEEWYNGMQKGWDAVLQKIKELVENSSGD